MAAFDSKKSVRKELISKIYFDGSVSVNREICSKVVVEMIKQLLYQRDQLPLPFDQLKRKLEAEAKPTNPENDCTPVGNASKLHKNTQMQQTYDSLRDLSQHLASALVSAENDVREILLLLGSTVATPRELYLVVLPPHRHCCSTPGRHCSEPATLRKCMTRVFREMITNFSLWDGGTLGPTNANVLLKMARRPYVGEHLVPELGFSIPRRGSRLVRFYLCECSPPPENGGDRDETAQLVERLEEMNLDENSDDSDHMWVKLNVTVKGLRAKSGVQSF